MLQKLARNRHSGKGLTTPQLRLGSMDDLLTRSFSGLGLVGYHNLMGGFIMKQIAIGILLYCVIGTAPGVGS